MVVEGYCGRRIAAKEEQLHTVFDERTKEHIRIRRTIYRETTCGKKQACCNTVHNICIECAVRMGLIW